MWRLGLRVIAFGPFAFTLGPTFAEPPGPVTTQAVRRGLSGVVRGPRRPGDVALL